MSSLSDIRESILTKFAEALAASSTPNLPVEAPNRRFKRPTSGAWGRVTINFGTRNPAALGSAGQKLNRTAFVLVLQVFVPENDGEKIAFEIVDDVIGRLDYGTRIATNATTSRRSNVQFNSSSILTVGRAGTDDDKGQAGLFQVNGSVDGVAHDWPG